MEWLLLIPVLVAVLVALYQFGVISVSVKRASMFMGDLPGATFRRCTGWLRRIIRVKADTRMCFTLEASLEKGEIRVELTDSRSVPILTLTTDAPEACADLTAGETYRITVRLNGADGRYRLHRHEV